MAVQRVAEVRIGARLRAARKDRGLTLERLAAATGLTKGFISRMERDEVSASVASLVAICGELGVRVGDLFDAPSGTIVRAGQGKPINFGGAGVREYLLSPGTERRLQVIRSLLDAGGHGGPDLYCLDADVEFVYVLTGSLEVEVENETVRLDYGDAFTFSGRQPHTWRNGSTELPAQVIWVLAPAP